MAWSSWHIWGWSYVELAHIYLTVVGTPYEALTIGICAIPFFDFFYYFKKYKIIIKFKINFTDINNADQNVFHKNKMIIKLWWSLRSRVTHLKDPIMKVERAFEVEIFLEEKGATFRQLLKEKNPHLSWIIWGNSYLRPIGLMFDIRKLWRFISWHLSQK